MDLKILEEIGLSEGEIKVYEALLELGTTTTGSIIKRSKVSASKVYNILNRLAEKGLVSHIIKAKTKYFRAADPERILEYMEEKEKELTEKKNKVKELLPELKEKFKEKPEQDAEVFEGIKGVQNIFWNLLTELKKGEEYYVMGASYGEEDENIKKFFEKYHRERIKKGIKVQIMFNYDIKSMIEATKKISKIKYMPQEIKSPSQFIVWKNKVSIILWKPQPMAFTIDNKEIAESFKLYFDSLWHQEVKSYKGIEAFKRTWLETISKGDTLYLIGAKGYFFDNAPEEVKEIVEFARKKNMKWKNIVDEEARGHEITKLPFTETRYFKKEINISAPGVIWICGGRIMISNWAKKEPILIVIDNKEVFKSYKKYFDILWNISEP